MKQLSDLPSYYVLLRWRDPMPDLTQRKRYEWKIRDTTLVLGERTLIVGVLNVTPDSFSDGGKFLDPDRAFARAIDSAGVGRAYHQRSQRGLDPSIRERAGACWSMHFGGGGLILNHMRGTPETWLKLPPLKDVIRTIGSELDACIHRAVRSGVDRRQLAVDPGLGFGKRKEQNAVILARLEELAQLDLPLMAGPSRKHFVARESSGETEFATAAAVTAAILHGAHMVRVHDVKAMKAVVEVADEIVRESGAGL